MARWIVFGLVCVLATPALADPVAEVKQVSEAFARAADAQDLQGVLALYADDARIIWPGQGDVANSKTDLEPLVRRFFARGKDAKLVPRSLTAIPLDDNHIADVGQWEDSFTTPAGKRVTVQVRTSEILVKRDGKWLYLVDHASIGLPPATPPARGRGPRERRGR